MSLAPGARLGMVGQFRKPRGPSRGTPRAAGRLDPGVAQDDTWFLDSFSSLDHHEPLTVGKNVVGCVPDRVTNVGRILEEHSWSAKCLRLVRVAPAPPAFDRCCDSRALGRSATRPVPFPRPQKRALWHPVQGKGGRTLRRGPIHSRHTRTIGHRANSAPLVR